MKAVGLLFMFDCFTLNKGARPRGVRSFAELRRSGKPSFAFVLPKGGDTVHVAPEYGAVCDIGGLIGTVEDDGGR